MKNLLRIKHHGDSDGIGYGNGLGSGYGSGYGTYEIFITH